MRMNKDLESCIFHFVLITEKSSKVSISLQRWFTSFFVEHETDDRENNNQQTNPEISKREIVDNKFSPVRGERGVQKKSPVKRETIIDDQGKPQPAEKQRQRTDSQQQGHLRKRNRNLCTQKHFHALFIQNNFPLVHKLLEATFHDVHENISGGRKKYSPPVYIGIDESKEITPSDLSSRIHR
jgi:hypothetical protein